jgi:Family of unknown function (DUF6152)
MTAITRNTFKTLALLVLLTPLVTQAHHSTLGFFDFNNKVEIQGVVRDVTWRNPHTVFELDVVNEQGQTVQWHIESGALAVLRAQGLTSEILKVGDRVSILGDSSLRGRPEMFARNVLLASGEEVMLTLGASPWFSTRANVAMREGSFDEAAIAKARAEANGIFRVWSQVEADLSVNRARPFADGNLDAFPFTEQGRQLRAQWNPSAEFILSCTEWQMPRLMNNPLPIQFVQQGENILLRFEEDDNERLIHMSPNSAAANQPASLLGYSSGHWEGTTLVVATSRLLESNHELPISGEASLVERFTPSADGNQLDYEAVLTDPVMLTTTVTQTNTWLWRPEITINRYACEEEQTID